MAQKADAVDAASAFVIYYRIPLRLFLYSPGVIPVRFMNAVRKYTAELNPTSDAVSSMECPSRRSFSDRSILTSLR